MFDYVSYQFVVDVVDEAVVSASVLREWIDKSFYTGVGKVQVNFAPVTFGNVKKEDWGIGNVAEEEGEREEDEEEDELVFAPSPNVLENVLKVFDDNLLNVGHLGVNG